MVHISFSPILSDYADDWKAYTSNIFNDAKENAMLHESLITHHNVFKVLRRVYSGPMRGFDISGNKLKHARCNVFIPESLGNFRAAKCERDRDRSPIDDAKWRYHIHSIKVSDYKHLQRNMTAKWRPT